VANTKTVYLPYSVSGASGLYARVFQSSTGYWLDNTDGVFKALPVDPEIPLTEQSGGPSVYYFSESRSVWFNGFYLIYGYTNVDYLFGGAEFYILSDAEVSIAVLSEYIEIVKKIEENNWELKNNQWIVYNDDGVTPLITFNCYDAVGNLTMENIFKRRKI
jgi:hypothetical protein